MVAIDIAEPELAERLRKLLAGVPGFAIAELDARSDVRLVASVSEIDGEGALTPRELGVLQLLVEGASNKEIARRLSISTSTVKFHVRSITDKLGADGRAEAVVHALRRGIVHV